VRDVYDLGDRLPHRHHRPHQRLRRRPSHADSREGCVLTQLSLFWFNLLRDLVPNHVISATVDEYPRELHAVRDQLDRRSMLVKKTEPFPVECVVRGYLVGIGMEGLPAHGIGLRIELPKGLRESERLEQPIFTPSTKAETGHDENISFEQMSGIVGAGPRGRAARPHPRALSPRARHARSAASSSPTPSSSSGRARAASSGSTRPSRRTRRASGRATATRRAARSRASTSNTSATT
jgi:phosphoribosylaminoimidazole-succinocarboxamide synthase